MWLNQYNQQEEEIIENKREVYEIDPNLTKMMQDSMYGNFGGSIRDEAVAKSKTMLTGAIIGVMVAVYFAKSPLYFGVGGAILARVIAK
jgi:hypothetical protein